MQRAAVLKPYAPWSLALLLCVSACTTPGPGGIAVIGHGGLGSGGRHPMNSGDALLGGLALGIDGVEMDVQLSADTMLVAYHAQLLEELTPCSGLVNASSWTQLRACPNSHEGDRPYPLVRLDSLLLGAAAEHPEAGFTLDIKLFAAGDWWGYLETFSDALVRLHARPSLRGRLIVECQVDEFLKLLHRKDPDLPLFLYATDAKDGMARAKDIGCAGVTMDNGRMTAEQVALAHEQDLQVALFGVGGWWSHRQAIGKRPDRVQTDAPEDLAPRDEER